MDIVRIFEGNNSLLSFKYDNEDDCEFDRLFELWNDIEFLDIFFEENEELLNESYWFSKTKNDIILETRNLAGRFERLLLSYADKDDCNILLEELFEPLLASNYQKSSLRKSKAKKSWLRIYALRINKSSFIITGGAIKLTKKMEDNESTIRELDKLNKCRDFLIEKGITDIEQIESIL